MGLEVQVYLRRRIDQSDCYCMGTYVVCCVCECGGHLKRPRDFSVGDWKDRIGCGWLVCLCVWT